MGDFNEEGRPWWVWLIILLIIAGIIWAILRFFVLGRGGGGAPSASPEPSPLVTETPTETPTPISPTITLTPFPTLLETPRTGPED